MATNKKSYRKSVSRQAELGGAGLPVLFLLITVGILAAGGFFVYKTVNKDGGGLSLPGNPLSKVAELAGGAAMPKATENDFSFVEDPLIRKHFAAQANVRVFRTTSGSDGRGAGEETITEVAMKSLTDVRFHTKMVSQGKDTTDMIVIGDTTYIKDQKDGKWWMEKAKPAPTGTAVEEDENKYKPEDFKEEYMEKQKMEYKKLGEEACGSLTCYKYEETESGNEDSPKRTFWFDTKNLLLRKEINGYGEFTSTTEYSYDDIVINVPAPTKEVPEGKSIYMYMMGEEAAKMMPSTKDLEDVQKMMEQYEGEDY